MYTLIELQTTNGQTENIVTPHEDKLQSESAFYAVMSAAAISQVEIHAAVLLDERGNLLMREFYRHHAEPEEA